MYKAMFITWLYNIAIFTPACIVYLCLTLQNNKITFNGTKLKSYSVLAH